MLLSSRTLPKHMSVMPELAETVTSASLLSRFAEEKMSVSAVILAMLCIHVAVNENDVAVVDNGSALAQRNISVGIYGSILSPATHGKISGAAFSTA